MRRGIFKFLRRHSCLAVSGSSRLCIRTAVNAEHSRFCGHPISLHPQPVPLSDLDCRRDLPGRGWATGIRTLQTSHTEIRFIAGAGLSEYRNRFDVDGDPCTGAGTLSRMRSATG
jgi:hypothetical protein